MMASDRVPATPDSGAEPLCGVCGYPWSIHSGRGKDAHAEGAPGASSKPTPDSGAALERPWCCPEPRCVPVHQLANRADLATPKPGDTFMCFGKMSEPVEFTYDGEHHKNDLNSCWATALKGIIRNQENSSDWRMLAGAYGEAYKAVTGG